MDVTPKPRSYHHSGDIQNPHGQKEAWQECSYIKVMLTDFASTLVGGGASWTFTTRLNNTIKCYLEFICCLYDAVQRKKLNVWTAKTGEISGAYSNTSFNFFVTGKSNTSGYRCLIVLYIRFSIQVNTKTSSLKLRSHILILLHFVCYILFSWIWAGTWHHFILCIWHISWHGTHQFYGILVCRHGFL